MSENSLNYKNFWYVVCEIKDVPKNKPLSKKVLNEWLVLFKSKDNNVIAMRDRCPHRNYKLSEGFVKDGCLLCPYHGWTFDETGEVVGIPAEGPNFKKTKSRRGEIIETCMQDGFVYVRLEKNLLYDEPPHRMPHYENKDYKTVRLLNKFKNNVTNCAENYVDVPHTVFVHPGIFRVSKQEKIDAVVERKEGKVEIEYKNETDNLGWFSWFLNPKKEPINHIDRFFSPNMTSVEYRFGKKSFFISSHCTPVNDEETHVYTDLTYNFGFLNQLAAPIVKYQGQAVIDQDIEVLNTQMEVIKKYGENFSNSTADIVHVLIESLREAISKGQDPRKLPDKRVEFEFWI